ncbi:hypothetical protein [Methanomethylovorans hollandica]|uniref:hypothetical protein n=1 Tax=Methanomethylovorans hollandica TaxID=101192 RepID=UPI0012EA520E|nr:hypothetical protein [Methanomethylovorans hollandica]
MPSRHGCHLKHLSTTKSSFTRLIAFWPEINGSSGTCNINLCDLAKYPGLLLGNFKDQLHLRQGAAITNFEQRLASPQVT